MIVSTRTATAICLALCALACNQGGGNDAAAFQDATVVAEVNGRAVTAGQIEVWIRDDLYARTTGGKSAAQLYDLRAKALHSMVEEEVLRGEARNRGTSVEEMLSQAVEARGGISDEEISAFYEQNKSRVGQRSLADLREVIRERLDLQKRTEVISELRKSADVTILLEPPRVEIAADGPSRGAEQAPVTIVEFSDFQCPFCRRAIPVIEEVLERYPNEVRLVYRHFPLESIHSRARMAAEASVCAQDQEKFWEYHDVLFENMQALEDDDLKRYAGEVGLDVAAFEKCLTERKFSGKVQDDLSAGRKAGVTGTPAFVINGIVLTGAKPVDDFVSVIEAELERQRVGDQS